MSYRAIIHKSGATTVGLFRPRTATGPVALLLGRTPEDWYGTAPSAQARALVDAGYWVVTVGTPNWGNQTDLDSIDEAVSWASASWGRDIGRLRVVAHKEGCIAALNWAVRHVDQVSSLNLLAPIIDLEERWDRVVADRASLEAAFGNADTFLEQFGANGAYASTPDHASLDITGTSDLDLRAEVAATDWTPGAARSIVSKYVTSGNQRSYRLRLTATGLLELAWSVSGTTALNALSTAAPTVADGETLAVRVTLDVNNGASGRTVTFYTAPTISGPWTQLGSAVTQAGTTSIFSGTAPLEVGSVASGIETFHGHIYKVEVRNGIGGTVVANPDFSAQTLGATSFIDATGKTWTLHGGAAIVSYFLAAMPTFNPNTDEFRPWGRRVLEQLADRMTMWWHPSDSDTPPAVHAALAAYYGCATGTLTDEDPTLVDSAPLVAKVIDQDTAWDQQNAATLWQKWAVYRRDNTDNNDWAGGDGHFPTPLPDGRVLWSHADTMIGGVDADESRAGFPPIIRNSIVVEGADGTLGETLHFTGNSGPAAVPPDSGVTGSWYWLGPAVIEGQNIRMLAIYLLPTGGFTIAGSHVVTFDLTTLVQTDAAPLVPFVSDYVWSWGVCEGPDYTYIVGTVPGEFLSGRIGLARAPLGNIRGTWEFWDGTGWSVEQTDAARLVDEDGNEIANSSPGIFRLSSGKWILSGSASPFEDYFDVYVSDVGPSQPDSWRLYQRVSTDPAGQKTTRKPYGGFLMTYGGNILVRHNVPAGRLVFGWGVNWLDSDPPSGLDAHIHDSALYQPRYIELPEPT